jgi:hypothetical protein
MPAAEIFPGVRVAAATTIPECELCRIFRPETTQQARQNRH